MQLHFFEDLTDYSFKQITSVIETLKHGQPKEKILQNSAKSSSTPNKDHLASSSQSSAKCNSFFKHVCSGCALLGFVRFLMGYYIVLITKERKAGQIGPCDVFGIEKTLMIPIFNSDSQKQQNSSIFKRILNLGGGQSAIDLQIAKNEAKYLQIFQSIELTKDFFFSYTYNLTKNLQTNMLHSNSFLNQKLSQTSHPTKQNSFAFRSSSNIFSQNTEEQEKEQDKDQKKNKNQRFFKDQDINNFEIKYTWNFHLLEPLLFPQSVLERAWGAKTDKNFNQGLDTGYSLKNPTKPLIIAQNFKKPKYHSLPTKKKNFAKQNNYSSNKNNDFDETKNNDVMESLFSAEDAKTFIPLSSIWIVPLIHGFFDQKKLQLLSGNIITLTLMGRRSVFYAGTRYLFENF